MSYERISQCFFQIDNYQQRRQYKANPAQAMSILTLPAWRLGKLQIYKLHFESASHQLERSGNAIYGQKTALLVWLRQTLLHEVVGYSH